MWPAAEMPVHNAGYQVSERLPGFLGFASNEGGELLAFDTRAHPWRICMIPFILLDESDAVEIAPDFETFAQYFGRALKAG